MGVPVSAATLITRNDRPSRIPISVKLLQSEIRAGVRSETYPPEKNPNMMATAMSPPGVAAPNTAKHIMPAPQHIKAIMLTLPILSATKFGVVRPDKRGISGCCEDRKRGNEPKVEAALRIARV